MRALILTDDAKAQIKNLIDFSKEHQYTADKLKKVIAGDLPPAGSYDKNTVSIPMGYRVVFSFEEQPCGWCRHLSVSVDKQGAYPSEPAVEMIMEEFGMGSSLKNCVSMWLEEEDYAVNVLTKDTADR